MDVPEIRSRFLRFYAERGHAVIPAAPIVPAGDASTLFITAGMQPLVPFFLGERHPAGRRVVDVQPCVRTDDIDEVGDPTHLTFLEMLGRWSLGDYDGERAVELTFDLLTGPDGLGLDPQRLYVTVFAGDDDAPRDSDVEERWTTLFASAGIDPEGRIFAYGKRRTGGGPSATADRAARTPSCSSTPARRTIRRSGRAATRRAPATGWSRSATTCSCATTAGRTAASTRSPSAASTPAWASSGSRRCCRVCRRCTRPARSGRSWGGSRALRPRLRERRARLSDRDRPRQGGGVHRCSGHRGRERRPGVRPAPPGTPSGALRPAARAARGLHGGARRPGRRALGSYPELSGQRDTVLTELADEEERFGRTLERGLRRVRRLLGQGPRALGRGRLRAVRHPRVPGRAHPGRRRPGGRPPRAGLRPGLPAAHGRAAGALPDGRRRRVPRRPRRSLEGVGLVPHAHPPDPGGAPRGARRARPPARLEHHRRAAALRLLAWRPPERRGAGGGRGAGQPGAPRRPAGRVARASAGRRAGTRCAGRVRSQVR